MDTNVERAGRAFRFSEAIGGHDKKGGIARLNVDVFFLSWPLDYLVINYGNECKGECKVR